MIPKANASNPSSISQQPVSSQPSVNHTQNNSVQTATPVTAQPTSWNPFSACFAAKNSTENIQSNTNNDRTPSARAKKIGIGAYFCTSLPIAIPVTLAAIPAIGVVGGILVGSGLGIGAGYPSLEIAEKIVTQQEQAEAKKQE